MDAAAYLGLRLGAATGLPMVSMLFLQARRCGCLIRIQI